MNMLIRMNCILVMKAMKKKKLRTLFKTIMSSSEERSPKSITKRVFREEKILPKAVKSAP